MSAFAARNEVAGLAGRAGLEDIDAPCLFVQLDQFEVPGQRPVQPVLQYVVFSSFMAADFLGICKLVRFHWIMIGNRKNLRKRRNWGSQQHRYFLGAGIAIGTMKLCCRCSDPLAGSCSNPFGEHYSKKYRSAVALVFCHQF